MQVFKKILSLTLALTLALSMGVVTVFAVEPMATLDIENSMGDFFTPEYDKAQKGETYNLVVYYESINNGFDPENVAVTWEVTDPSTVGVVALGTQGGNYDDGFTNSMTINDYGSFTLTVKIAEGTGSVHTIRSTIVTEPDPNSPFFFAYYDRYGVEDKDAREYPGETLYMYESVNKSIKSLYNDDFISTKLPVSVSCDNTFYEFKFEDIVQKNDKFYGSILSRIKKEPTGTAEWTVDDIGKTFETQMTITFVDGSSVKYNYYTEITHRPSLDIISDDGVVEAGKTYTQKFEVIDKKDVLTDSMDITGEWKVEIGSDDVMLGASSVTVKAVGTKTPLINTVKFSGRGVVVMRVDIRNYPRFTSEENQKNMHSIWHATYIVNGDASPIMPDRIVAAPGSDSSKTVIEVPSSNNLNLAAITRIKELAEAAGSDKIELKLGAVSVGIGVSGLTNPEFLAAVEKNGGIFDPLITLAAPTQAAMANINTGGGKWLDFAHNGKLPGESTISLNVSDFFGDADNLVLWYFNKDTEKMEKREEIAVDYDKEGGNCSFKIDHCSAWALYPDIEGFSPNIDELTPRVEDDNDSSSGGDIRSAPSYPTADKGLETLAKIKDIIPTSLPLNAKLTKTAAGKEIAVIPVTLINGNMGVLDLAVLGKLGASLGLEIKQNGVDILIPGGYGAITEVGRFAYYMQYNKLAANSSEMIGAVKGTDALSYTCTIGSNVTLPTTVTVTLTTDIKRDGDVNVYRYDVVTGKPVLVAKSKATGGKVIFATKQLGQFMVTTGTV